MSVRVMRAIESGVARCLAHLLMAVACCLCAGCRDQRGVELSTPRRDSAQSLKSGQSASSDRKSSKAEPAAMPAGPVVCDEPVWDFGDENAETNAELSHQFQLKSNSDVAIAIERIKPTCGCIVAANQPTQIGPRGSAEIAVSVTLPDRALEFSKAVDVDLATTPASSIRLTIQGTVRATSALYSEPGILDFGLLSESEVKTRSVRLARYDNSPVRLLEANCESSAVRLEPAPSTDSDDSHSVTLPLSLDSTHLDPGEFRSRLIITTEHAKSAEAIVPIRAWIRQPHGIVNCLFVKLAPGASQDVAMTEGAPANGTTPTIERVSFEGDSRLTVEFCRPTESGAAAAPPQLRVSRNAGEGDSRLARGEVVATLQGREKPIRIALVAHLVD